MSSLRPGTVDYSKWENLDVSSSDDDNEEERHGAEEEDEYHLQEAEMLQAEDDDDDELESYSEDDSEDEGVNLSSSVNARPPAPVPTASLATLERVWKMEEEDDDDATTPTAAAAAAAAADGSPVVANTTGATFNETSLTRQCAACFSEGPPLFRCSRCQMVWFCNRQCQRAYHPVHKAECIDAKQHFQYWGCFKKQKIDEDASEVLTPEQRRLALQNALHARIQIRRRRALKKAAAAAAVERARLAREARGQVKGKGKGASEKEETCAVCQCEFTLSGDAGAGLCCPSSHFMCNECSGVYCNSVVGDLQTSYPPKCPMCRALLPIHHFVAQLTPPQLALVKTHAAEVALKPNQVLAKCKECGHFEIETTPGSVVWWCEACEHGTCFVCHKDLPRGVVKYDLDKSVHADCKALRFVKVKVEQAIEEGSQMACPGCGLKGRKDDACTHMSCPKCATEWCYVCGLSVADCDKAPPAAPGRPTNDIYLHNRDWEINEKRCPMYLTQILEIDLSWLGDDWDNVNQDDFEDDEKCLDHFHRFRTIQNLQKARREVGAEVFHAVFEKFESIRNAGYTLEEVITTCTDQLIDREDFIRHQAEHPDDGEDVGNEGGLDDAEGEGEEFETIPEEVMRDVLQQGDLVRQVLEASRQDQEMGNVNGTAMDNGQDGSVDEQEEEEEFEEVPEAMTRVVLQEEENMQHATEASRASAHADEVFRQVMAESMVE